MSQLLRIFCLMFVFSVGINGDKDTDFYKEVRNSRDFTGKVILITGSNSGIGKTTAKLFSALGASLVVTGRKSEDVHKAAQEVQSASPKTLKPLEVVADLTKSEDVEHLFNKTIEHFGKLDVLVNDAGSYIINPITDPKFMEKFETNLDIDLKPALQLIKLSIPYLEKTKGSVVSISSFLTERPLPGLLSYVVAKEALQKASEVLAQELGPIGIRVNTISPGSIESHGSSPKSEENAKKVPLRRNGQPEDIARGVVFLASTDAQFITGTNILIDGGIKFVTSSAGK